MSIDTGFVCLDCQVNTSSVDGIAEYYMLHTELWIKINPIFDGMLCIGCAEARLGRQLIPADFVDAPVNKGFFRRSPRMVSRVEPFGWLSG